MKVEYWCKKPSRQSRNISRHTSIGLTVDGVNYTWKEVEEKWNMTGRRFSKRLHANPAWSMEKLLTAPVQTQRQRFGKKVISKDGKAVRESRKSGNNHLPEQLWANEVACLRWV